MRNIVREIDPRSTFSRRFVLKAAATAAPAAAALLLSSLSVGAQAADDPAAKPGAVAYPRQS